MIGVIDAGHGGKDPGCIGRNTGVAEKDLSLDYCLEIEKEAKKRGHRLVLTRRKDIYLTLGERAEIANSVRGAEFFCSVHFDWNWSSQPRGTWGFYHNAVQYDYSTRQVVSETSSRWGKPLAEEVVNNVVRQAGTVNRGTQPRPMYVWENGEQVRREGQLYVLRHTVMPATLLEVCFLSNPDDERLALDDDFRRRVVAGVLAGIETWIKMKRGG